MTGPSIDPNHLVAIIIPMIFLGLILSVAMVIPYWLIFKKAGFSPWLSILMFVPLANIIILYVIAFSPWRVVPVPPYSVTQFPRGPNRP